MDQVIFVTLDTPPTRAQNQEYEQAGLQSGHSWQKSELQELQAQRGQLERRGQQASRGQLGLREQTEQQEPQAQQVQQASLGRRGLREPQALPVRRELMEKQYSMVWLIQQQNELMAIFI